MEKASEVLAVKAEFDWDDVGSWTALPDHLENNEGGSTLRGEVVEHASRNIALSNGRLIAICGVGLIVVETPDAVLVCHRDAAQEIRSSTSPARAGSLRNLASCCVDFRSLPLGCPCEVRKLGKSELQVSVVGLGTMSWPGCNYGDSGYKPGERARDRTGNGQNRT